MQEQGAVSNQHSLGRATVQWQRGRKNQRKTREPARTGGREADSRHPIQQGPKRISVKSSNARSPRPEPAQSLIDRVVVDAQVPSNRADAIAAGVHRSNLQGDRLVDRGLNGPEKLRLNRNLGNGAKALRTRPPLLVGVRTSQNNHRKNSKSR